jgi:DNA-binding CsgD family transcriptional regulator/tetratricopeptide (TPR) repeat protein
MAHVSQRVSSPTFIGRAHESAALREALERTRGGQPVAVLVAGEAGVGKTRLVNEFSSTASAEGSRVLIGGCIELSQGSLPFAPIVEALRGLVEGTKPEALDELLGATHPDLGRLLPELVTGPAQQDVGAGPDFAQGRLFEQFLGLLQRLAERSPTILIIEDLHWADDSTLDLIRFLLRNLREPDPMLLITYRSDEIHRRHPLRPFLTALDRIDSVERLELARFDRNEVSEQLRSILGENPDPEVVSRAYELSEGNPFYVEELLATGAGSSDSVLPNSLREAVMVRVEALSGDSQDVLRVAATAGCRVHDSVLAKVSVLEERRLHEALREAVARHLLVTDERGGFYEFRHALVREAIYSDLLPGEKTTLHATFAKILQATPELGGGGATGAAELAYHFHQAHMIEAALPASILAGEAAESTFAFPEALRQYERALELWSQVEDPEERTRTSRVELIRRAAEAAYLAARPARAIGHTKAAIELVDPDIDPVTSGLMHERLGRYHFAGGHTDEGLAAYAKAVRLVPSEPPSAERALVLAAEAQMLMLLSHGKESRVLCEEAVRIATEVGAKAELGHALNTLGVNLAMMGDFDAGLLNLYEAKKIALELDAIDDIGRLYANIPSILVWAGRYEEAFEQWHEGLDAVTRRGAGGSYGSWYRADMAEVLFRVGRWDEADLATREPGSESGTVRAMRLCTRSEVATARGRLDDARADLEEARRYSVGVREPQYVGPSTRAHAHLALAEGDPRQARSIVQKALKALGDSEELADPAFLCYLGVRAESDLAAEGNASSELAQKLLDKVRRLKRASDDHLHANPIIAASAAMAEAEHSRLERPDPEAWHLAASLWVKAGHPYPEAYCLFRQSEASLATGGGDARDPLLRACEVATRLGAAPLLTEIQSLARRGRISLGEPLRRRGPSTSLTPREIDVLRLVADGKTNSEIGRELFISTKTASVHVSHILQKLSVSSRVQAAGAARDMDLVSGT